MNFKIVFNLLHILHEIIRGYSKGLTLLAGLIEHGTYVLRSVHALLLTDKYAPIRAHFEKSMLALISSVTHFKTGMRELNTARKADPKEFAFVEGFLQEFVGFEDKLNEVADSVVDVSAELKESSKDCVVPKFIRESGEYMDFVNQGRREMLEPEFVEFLAAKWKKVGWDEALEELNLIQTRLKKQGYIARILDSNTTVVFWGDELIVDIHEMMGVPKSNIVEFPANKTEQ